MLERAAEAALAYAAIQDARVSSPCLDVFQNIDISCRMTRPHHSKASSRLSGCGTTRSTPCRACSQPHPNQTRKTTRLKPPNPQTPRKPSHSCKGNRACSPQTRAAHPPRSTPPSGASPRACCRRCSRSHRRTRREGARARRSSSRSSASCIFRWSSCNGGMRRSWRRRRSWGI